MACEISPTRTVEPCYLTLDEFCRQVGLSASTIRRLVKSGRIPFVQPAGKGGKLLFRPDALEHGRASPTPTVPSPPPVRGGRVPAWMIRPKTYQMEE